MKWFLDSSVLIAAFFEKQEHHTRSFALLEQCDPTKACSGAHTIAEVYSTLTGIPGSWRASQDEALLYLYEVRKHISIIALTPDEYFQALEESARLGIIGGGIYDALLAQMALKANAETIYTWNVKHFTRLGPEIASRVATP